MQISFNKEIIRLRTAIINNQSAIQTIESEKQNCINRIKKVAKQQTKNLIDENKKLEKRLKMLL